MHFLILNGPNLNLLGQREPGIYGKGSYDNLCKRLTAYATQHACTLECVQSNYEGALIEAIHKSEGTCDAIIINPAAFSHYSYAILDALKGVTTPAVEVHISNIHQREAFRHTSVTAGACVGQISGLGFYGYEVAMHYFLQERAECV